MGERHKHAMKDEDSPYNSIYATKVSMLFGKFIN